MTSKWLCSITKPWRERTAQYIGTTSLLSTDICIRNLAAVTRQLDFALKGWEPLRVDLLDYSQPDSIPKCLHNDNGPISADFGVIARRCLWFIHRKTDNITIRPIRADS